MTTEVKAITKYLEHADNLFDEVRKHFLGTSLRLAQSIHLDKILFENIKSAVDSYIEKILKVSNIDIGNNFLYTVLDQNIDKIGNLTENGAIIAKKEMAYEANNLQKAIVEFAEAHNAGQIFELAQCPGNVRISEKNRLKAMKVTDHPYASTKYHSDVWAGEPIDSVIFVMPIYYGGECMNIEIADTPPKSDFNCLQKFSSYDEAIETIDSIKPNPFQLKIGMCAILDSRAVHRTLFDHLPVPRVSVDFRFRIKKPTQLSSFILDTLHKGYINYDLWKNVGTTKRLVFNETYNEYIEKNAEKGRDGAHRYKDEYAPTISDL